MYYTKITDCKKHKILTNTTQMSDGLRTSTERKQFKCTVIFLPVYYTPTRVLRVISQGHRVLFPSHCPCLDLPSQYDSHLFRHSVNFPSLKKEAVLSSENVSSHLQNYTTSHPRCKQGIFIVNIVRFSDLQKIYKNTSYGRDMAEEGLSLRRYSFGPGPVRMRILADILAQRQVCPSNLDFLCMLCASISSIYPRLYRATV